MVPLSPAIGLTGFENYKKSLGGMLPTGKVALLWLMPEFSLFLFLA